MPSSLALISRAQLPAPQLSSHLSMQAPPYVLVCDSHSSRTVYVSAPRQKPPQSNSSLIHCSALISPFACPNHSLRTEFCLSCTAPPSPPTQLNPPSALVSLLACPNHSLITFCPIVCVFALRSRTRANVGPAGPLVQWLPWSQRTLLRSE